MRAREFLHLDNLNEGVGLARRKPGERFVNPKGDVWIFQNLTFYPNKGKYQNQEELEKKRDEHTEGIHVTWVNEPKKNSLAFGIAAFKNESNNTFHYIGKYYEDIKANRNDNKFPHDQIPGGFQYKSKAGAKETAGYKPSQILKTFKGLNPESIVEQIESKFGGPDSDEGKAARIFLKAHDFPVRVPKGQMNFDAFKIYLCEMLQPIALVKGMTIKGNLNEALDKFFGDGKSLSECKINFNDSQGGELSDSVLIHPAGNELKVSTKDAVGGGAKASAQNLLKCIKELEKTKDGRKILSKHQQVVDILNVFKGKATVDKNGDTKFDGKTHYSAPLDLAVMFKIITEDEAKEIINLKNLNLDLGSDPIGKKILSSDLEDMYMAYMKKWKKPVVPIHTMMLIIAGEVTKHVNEHTNFSSAASEILNNSALIQVYNDVVQSDKDFLIKGMHAVFPSKAVTGVKLTTEKAYWTTGAQGNMTFHILYNNESFESMHDLGDSPDADSPEEPTVLPEPMEPVQEPPPEEEPQQQEPPPEEEPVQDPQQQQEPPPEEEPADETDPEISQIQNLAGIRPKNNSQTEEPPGITNQKKLFSKSKIMMGNKSK